VLAQELAIAAQQAELHSLAHALQQWADRTRLPEVRNLVMVLIQSEKLGADAASTLNELATNFRVTARQRAEAQANRTSFWMLFPSVFCFWIAASITLIGPAYLEYFQFRREASEMLRDATGKIKGIQPEPAAPAQPGADANIP
jgi:tight adherence protein C